MSGGVNSRKGVFRMKVTVHVYASLARYAPEGGGGKEWVVEAEDGTRVGMLLRKLGIPSESVKLLFLNGVHAEWADPLKEGDRLGVFPPVAGG